MAEYSVIVTDDRFGSYKEENEVFSELGINVGVYNFSNEAEAANLLKEADAVLVNLFPLTKNLINKMNRCMVISRYGVGYDNVDVEAATKKSIWVTRVPDYSMEDVSDQALSLLLGCIRKTAYKDRMIREGRWNLQKEWP